MGRPKGGKNRKWTNEERLKYVLLCEEELLSPEYVERNYGVSAGTLRGWIKRYRRGGITLKSFIRGISLQHYIHVSPYLLKMN